MPLCPVVWILILSKQLECRVFRHFCSAICAAIFFEGNWFVRTKGVSNFEGMVNCSRFAESHHLPSVCSKLRRDNIIIGWRQLSMSDDENSEQMEITTDFVAVFQDDDMQLRVLTTPVVVFHFPGWIIRILRINGWFFSGWKKLGVNLV